jgi:methylenetetrahydrofolate reductase (NADH)
MRARGLFGRAKVIVGITPLRSSKQARFMDEKLPGVSVPTGMIRALDDAGEDASAVGLDLMVPLVAAIRKIPGIAGIHVMAMGHDEATRALVARAGLSPRPAV